MVSGFAAFGQDAQNAAAEAAKALLDAPEAAKEVKKPNNWTSSLMTNLNFGQTSLTNWAAGGDNTYSLKGYVDGNANWKKGEMFWNNRLQLDYGFIYASSKPLLQKSDDRIYLESKYGYKVTDKLSLSANYNFKSQFARGWTYATPATKTDAEGNVIEPTSKDWKEARVPKSNFLSPAYTNIALGIDYKPTGWLSVNFAPLTGGFVISKDPEFRKAYSIDEDKVARFEFGTQLKVDAKVIVNEVFTYTTQLVLFSNYLDHPENLRVNWDNRIDYKLAKYFTLTVASNLIYDDKVMITSPVDGTTRQRIQFKESLAFGFTYTFAAKK